MTIDVEGRSIKEIGAELCAALRKDPQHGDLIDEYFSISISITYNSSTESVPGHRLNLTSIWPTDTHWIACYAVTGNSEGHYIHVDLIRTGETRDLVFLGKTFQGMQHAQLIAAKCAELLGA